MPPSIEIRVRRMIAHYTPDKVPDADSVLAKYRGNEQKLLAAYVAKYGPEPNEMDTASPEELRSRIRAMMKKYMPTKSEDEISKQLAAFAGKEKTVLKNMIKKLGPEPAEETDTPTSPATAAAPPPPPPVSIAKPLPRIPLEPIPKSLEKFSRHAILVRKVDKLCRDKLGRRARILVVTPYAIFLCSPEGEVKRTVLCAAVTAIRCANNNGVVHVSFSTNTPPDLAIACAPYTHNTSNDPMELVRIVKKAVLAASTPGTKDSQQLLKDLPIKEFNDLLTVETTDKPKQLKLFDDVVSEFDEADRSKEQAPSHPPPTSRPDRPAEVSVVPALDLASKDPAASSPASHVESTIAALGPVPPPTESKLPQSSNESVVFVPAVSVNDQSATAHDYVTTDASGHDTGPRDATGHDSRNPRVDAPTTPMQAAAQVMSDETPPKAEADAAAAALSPQVEATSAPTTASRKCAETTIADMIHASMAKTATPSKILSFHNPTLRDFLMLPEFERFPTTLSDVEYVWRFDNAPPPRSEVPSRLLVDLRNALTLGDERCSSPPLVGVWSPSGIIEVNEQFFRSFCAAWFTVFAVECVVRFKGCQRVFRVPEDFANRVAVASHIRRDAADVKVRLNDVSCELTVAEWNTIVQSH